jgi:hypothetical protein
MREKALTSYRLERLKIHNSNPELKAHLKRLHANPAPCSVVVTFPLPKVGLYDYLFTNRSEAMYILVRSYSTKNSSIVPVKIYKNG